MGTWGSRVHVFEASDAFEVRWEARPEARWPWWVGIWRVTWGGGARCAPGGAEGNGQRWPYPAVGIVWCVEKGRAV